MTGGRDRALHHARLRPQHVAAAVRAAVYRRAPATLWRALAVSIGVTRRLAYLLFGTLLKSPLPPHAVLAGSELAVEATLDSLLLGFSVAFQPDVLLYAFLGCVVGTLVGMLPGIGPLAGISILLPVTFGLDATKAIVMLAGIYYGSQYGGSTTSILMRIPGEAASVMTCIDGYAMAQKGRAGAALCIAAVGSFIAGTFGVIVLTVIAPPLAAFALRFGPPEYTALLVARPDLPRLHVVDVAGAHAADGGVRAAARLHRHRRDDRPLPLRLRHPRARRRHRHRAGRGRAVRPRRNPVDAEPHRHRQSRSAPRLRELLPTRKEWRESAMPIARGSVLGFLVGIVPGSAHIISSFLSYALEKRISKHPEEFGKGAVAGVAGPESANNAASTGAFVPMLALGLPTGPVTAVLMAALLIHGVPPGPQLVTEHPRRVLGLHRLDVCRQPDAARAQPAAGRHVRQRAADSLRLSLSADHHVLHHRRVRGEPLDRRRLDHADHGRRRLSAAQVRLRPGAAGAGPRHRADLRDEPAPVADHVERHLDDLLRAADFRRRCSPSAPGCWCCPRCRSC